MLWPVLGSVAAASALLAAAFFAGHADGVRDERLAQTEADLKAVAETDKSDQARIDALALNIATLIETDAKAEAARVEALEGLRRAIAKNRPPTDGARITAADLERLQPIYDAANAARLERGGGRIESDESGARALRGREARAYPPE